MLCRVVILGLLVGLMASFPATGYAQRGSDAGGDQDCTRQYVEALRPYVDQLVWYMGQSSNYPLTAQARPVVTGWPYSAYGPGNGYGPGSPYGPAFGPWGAGAVGPGFGGPGGYGLGPESVGGPAWLAANGFAGAGSVALGLTPPGLGYGPALAQIAASPGGIPALMPGDLATAAQIPQLLTGNVFAAGSLAQTILGNRTADAQLRQAVVGNRLSAASLNAALALYPSQVASNLGQGIQALQSYYQALCGLTGTDAGSGDSANSGGAATQ